MKEFCHCARFRVDSRQVGTFVQIAVNASQGEVIDAVVPAMNFRNDVLDVKHSEGRVLLVKVAILTSVGGALSYPSFRTRQHVYYRDLIISRACRWRIAMNLFARA